METLLFLAAAVLVFVLIRRPRRGRGSNLVVAPYDEIKRMIRSGEARPANIRSPRIRAKPLERIFSIPDDRDLFFALLEHIHAKEFGAREPLTELERAVHAAFMVGGEVGNGGFDQYFFNSAGDDAELALRTLLAAGALETADVLQRAMRAVGYEKVSQDREARWEHMDDWPEEVKDTLWDLSCEIFDLDEDPEELLGSYARAHREGFEPIRPRRERP